ncbi:MAG: NAD(P)/FAD-dependent oxidoreductase [Gemmatimonadaceae bacterium]
MFDVAIVGGGPAGLSAAVWLGRHLRSVVLVDSGDPRNWETRGVHGYLGLPDVTPADLRERGRTEAKRYGASLIDGCVDKVDSDDDEPFQLTLEDGRTYLGRRLLLAIGIKDIWPDVPGLERCYGETVHHCPNCDGYETRHCKTVVIASGAKAVGMAMDLTTWTKDLLICTHGAEPNIKADDLLLLDRANIPVLSDRILSLVSNEGRLEALVLQDGRELDCDRLYFAIGQYPADDLGARLGCKRDEDGLILVDDGYHTSVPNIFAAGDIIPGPHLAVAAAADGAIAALAIHRSLD